MGEGAILSTWAKAGTKKKYIQLYNILYYIIIYCIIFLAGELTLQSSIKKCGNARFMIWDMNIHMSFAVWFVCFVECVFCFVHILVRFWAQSEL